MYHSLRTVAYEPDPDHGPWQEDLHVLRLGEGMHEELTRRQEQLRSGRPYLPVARLHSLLRAWAPGVLATGRNAGADGQLPWLYAREPVPGQVLAPLIGTWAAAITAGQDEVADLEEELCSEDETAPLALPQWETECVDLTETTVSAGGTAEPLPRLYRLLPEAVAFRLAGAPFRTEGGTLRFRVVSSGTGGVDLVSWPPLRYERRNQVWYYSALLTVSVHTVPFAPRFRVHVATGVRRWATVLDIPRWKLGGATVLLDAPLPWPEGPDKGYRLMVNTLGYEWSTREVTWKRRSPALLLPDLDITRRFPAPTELFNVPEQWLDGRQEVAAGIVYHPVLGPHEVGAGLMPRERAGLGAWIEQRLGPVLRRVTDLKRVTRRNTPTLLPRSARRGESSSAEVRRTLARRTALSRALDGRPLDVEVLWQSPETRDALLAALPQVIGLAPGSRTDEDGVTTWTADGVRIVVRTRQAGRLASPLRLSTDRKRRPAVRLADAITERCALVAEADSGARGGVGLVIAEIAGRTRFAAVPDSDPKHALRLAHGRQGRLIQFINLPESGAAALEHRAGWTWLDTFRQLGAISPPVHRAGAGIPGDLQYAALWLVRHSKDGPTRSPARRLVAVRVRADSESGTVEGWDAGEAEWVPYPAMLLSLAQADSSMAPTDLEREIRTVLFQLRDRPTLLLVNSGNLRQCWPRLRNGELTRDMLAFGADRQQHLAAYGEDLRMVLVRDENGRGEVPEWYAHDRAARIGFSEGVWALSDDPHNRVFASTAGTPPSAARPKGLMKLVPGPGSRIAPGMTAWNPRLLEVTVLGCRTSEQPADRPVDWATLTHQLRYHDDYPPLAYPLPLHLAQLAKEYVLPLAQRRDQGTQPGESAPNPQKTTS
ncbi:pPIWI_RE module domain-containing protein [Streptomyces sp. NPDC127033]|uniref:pPIWI_RE module domain-containing protein n=1 Tax=Streptomyces sp. NPDC127033 TaxID=3347110 RepID=UPI003655A58F